MFNPFKKKDNSFNLDDISLPSLGDNDFSQNKSSQNDFEMPELPSLDTPKQENNSFDSMPSNNFQRPESTNPMLNPLSSSNNSEVKQENNSSVHQEITKAQLETLMSKINLMDARQQNMEQKLEMIYQIILNEVSEDTKRKLNIQSMMNKIR